MKPGTFCGRHKKREKEINKTEEIKKQISKKQRKSRNRGLALTKNPPASMNVMTVTEAKVVAFFKSIKTAPIASPSP